jgi:ABC-type phosphate transport system permease subunit
MKGKFTAAGRVVRWSTIAAVVLVAAVAGVVSHDHALAVMRAHGESGAVALLAALDVHPHVAMRILRHSKISVTM